jgi:hypothetical protein
MWKNIDVSEERTASKIKMYVSQASTGGLLFVLFAHMASPSILKVGSVRSSETSVNLYQATRRQIPEDVFHTHRREKLWTSQILF